MSKPTVTLTMTYEEFQALESKRIVPKLDIYTYANGTKCASFIINIEPFRKDMEAQLKAAGLSEQYEIDGRLTQYTLYILTDLVAEANRKAKIAQDLLDKEAKEKAESEDNK